ncbi:MAG: DUF2330 domain-containing protein [Myxococcota bacterium]|nr:DUF2330 domain-containing protein [Myxococcota bacterium]
MRKLAVLGTVVAGILSSGAVARDARACGGCFHEPLPPSQSGTVVTDHRMIFSISPLQTSLYDQIKYAGAPASFAWVLPIRSAVTVGLSSDTVFAALEQATQTEIVAPLLPPCPASNCPCRSQSAAGGPSAASVDAGSAVTIISQQTIGPYATVQLQSTDPNALNAWLTANGYLIPPDVQPIITAYVHDGFDFLALKLAPGQGIQAMRPVRVTSPGAGLTLPLRMVAAGTGAIVGITLWVVADGRYEPQNFQYYTISPSELVWDWSVARSTYTTVRTKKEAASNNWAWQIESSLAISPYQIENPVLNSFKDDYTPVPASDAGDGGGGKTVSQVRQEDLATLFPGGGAPVRITRMRADLAHAALSNDLVLRASTDQSTLSNIYQVNQSANAPACPPLPNCPCSGGSSGSGGLSTSSGSGGSSGPGVSSGSGGGGSSGSGGSGGGSPGASSSNGSSGTAGGGGVSGDGGVPEIGLSAGGGSGCSATSAGPRNGAVELAAAGFFGMALLVARRKRSSARTTESRDRRGIDSSQASK